MPEEAADLIGGRYLLAEPVSQGGLGRIWRGHDQLLDREVAVTEISLPPQGAARADGVEAIMREVRAAARRGGRGGIMVHDVARYGDALWVVTQPGDAESLDAEIARTGRLHRQQEAGGKAPAGSAPRVASCAAGSRGRGIGGLTDVLRANAGLAVGVATGIVMILALILVVVLFPARHRPAAPPGRPAVTSTASPSAP